MVDKFILPADAISSSNQLCGDFESDEPTRASDLLVKVNCRPEEVVTV